MLNIQDKSRMREIRSYGSVRGALGDQSPYRDRHNSDIYYLYSNQPRTSTEALSYFNGSKDSAP